MTFLNGDRTTSDSLPATIKVKVRLQDIHDKLSISAIYASYHDELGLMFAENKLKDASENYAI